jgi:pantetheine-phosphate adenylyltransferase
MNTKIIIYPGSFDPPTNGHLDLIIRASKIFDKVIVLVVQNINKKPFFSIDERIEMLKLIIKNRKLKNVFVDQYRGLLVDYLKEKKINLILRGLRAVSDFDYEFQMVLTNRKMYPKTEIIYLMPDYKWVYLSSSLVKEIVMYKGDVSKFVPKEVLKFIKNKY